MRKGKVSNKIFGLAPVFLIVGLVFGGIILTDKVCGDLTESVADAESFDENYNNFNSVKGIDVSHWQGNIEWSKVYNLEEGASLGSTFKLGP